MAKPPDGAWGLRWGDDASAAAAKLGVPCAQWEIWEGGQGFEVCVNHERVVEAYGEKGYARLIRKGTRLVALQLTFTDCADRSTRLGRAVREAFGLRSGRNSELYHTWSSGEVVHLTWDARDQTCTLTVADPQFGKAYAAYLLAQGLGSLSDRLRPH